MLTTLEGPIQPLSSAQAMELFVLVDLEAEWENLRVCKPDAKGTMSTLKELRQKQKAHEAFIAKLVAYNKAHKPVHVPESLLNTASRLRGWCWRMRDLMLQIQGDPHSHCPTHLLEKGYRWADRVADRMKKNRMERPALSTTIPNAIQELEGLARWCDDLASAAS